MKPTLRQLGISMILVVGILAGCTGTPQDDSPLPTLAQLPSLTPNLTSTLIASDIPAATAIATKASSTASETPVTPNPIVLPDALEPTATSTSVNDFGFDVYPDILEVGAQLTLQGTLTTDDTNSGKALLTNDRGQTIKLLVDPFTASVGNNQIVQITGTVEKQPDDVENAVRVSGINMLDAALDAANPVYPLADAQLTLTPSTP